MNDARKHYLLSTPRELLSPSDKRLQTIIKKYGSIANSLKRRDVGDLVLGGYNGGKKTGNKGFSTWNPKELSEYASQRLRDSKGRFVREESTDDSTPT